MQMMSINNTQPLLTIVVPMYNVESYIKQLILSIKAQVGKSKDLEVILVNDGSTDNSFEIAEELVENENFFKLVSKQNGGLSDARNFGMEMATGTYLWFLDGDDYLFDNTIFRILDALKEFRPDVLQIDYDVVSNESRFEQNTTDVAFAETTAFWIDSQQMLKRLGHRRIPNYTWMYIIKKDIVIRFGLFFPFGRLYEDMATTYSWFLASKIFIHLRLNAVAYRKRPGSISSKRTPRAASDIATSLREIEKVLPPEVFLKYFGNFILYFELLAYQEDGYDFTGWNDRITQSFAIHKKYVSTRTKIAYLMFKARLYPVIQAIRRSV